MRVEEAGGRGGSGEDFGQEHRGKVGNRKGKPELLYTILFEDIFVFTAGCCLEQTHLSVNMQRARKVWGSGRREAGWGGDGEELP